LDAADSRSVDGGDSAVSSLSPSGTPGVSNDVVVLATRCTVSDGSDGVVESGTASGGVDDSAAVLPEDGIVGLDGDGDDTLVEGSLELSNAVSLDVVDTGDQGGGTLHLGSNALSGLSVT